MYGLHTIYKVQIRHVITHSKIWLCWKRRRKKDKKWPRFDFKQGLLNPLMQTEKSTKKLFFIFSYFLRQRSSFALHGNTGISRFSLSGGRTGRGRKGDNPIHLPSSNFCYCQSATLRFPLIFRQHIPSNRYFYFFGSTFASPIFLLFPVPVWLHPGEMVCCAMTFSGQFACTQPQPLRRFGMERQHRRRRCSVCYCACAVAGYPHPPPHLIQG